MIGNSKTETGTSRSATNQGATTATETMASTSGGSSQMTVNPGDRSPVAVATITLQGIPNKVVFQEDSQGGVTLTLQGKIQGGNAGTIEASASLVGQGVGQPFTWTTLGNVAAGASSFSFPLRVSSGGWYSLSVRASLNGTPGASATAVFGVGEVFVAAGQSNASNCGKDPYASTTGLVVAMSGTYGSAGAAFVTAADPLPFPTLPQDPNIASDGCTGGSPWSRLGDLLASQLHVPVAFVMTAWGGTSIAEWQSGAKESDGQPDGFLHDRLAAAVAHFGANGIRAVLWHQGESDRGISSQAQYQAGLQALIDDVRQAAGWPVPFGIAQASYLPFRTYCYEQADPYSCLLTVTSQMAAIREAQQSVGGSAPNFSGPDTDGIGPSMRDDGRTNIHFTADGLMKHARLWKNALQTSFPDLFSGHADPEPFVDQGDLAYLPGEGGNLYAIRSDGHVMNYVDTVPGGTDTGATGQSLQRGLGPEGEDVLWLIANDKGVWRLDTSGGQWAFTSAYLGTVLPSSGGRAYGIAADHSVWAYSPTTGWASTGASGTSLSVGTDTSGNDELWLEDAQNTAWKYQLGPGGTYSWSNTGATVTQLVAGQGGAAYGIAGDSGIWAYSSAAVWANTGATGKRVLAGLDLQGRNELWLQDSANGIWVYAYVSSINAYAWQNTGGHLSSMVLTSHKDGIIGLGAGAQVWSTVSATGFTYRVADHYIPFYLLDQ